MKSKTTYYLTLAVIAPVAAACATGGAPQTAAAPAVAPAAETMPAPEAGVVEAREPGRFDMGKMWTFENAPLDYFQEAYGFEATEQWLEQVRLATLRIPGCTASFVSPNGLVASNHHCARGATSGVTREGENLLDDGFYAPTLEDERPVPNMWADQMVEMHDVTALIEAAVDPMTTESRQVEARDARMESVGDSASSATGLRCSVTSLYQGGKHSMYCYKRYTNIRMVFVPELQIGYFGGDPDNFTYPRYNLDISFFRVYDDDGNPLQPQSFFRWSDDVMPEGTPLFVIGNPGSTERLSTVAQLENNRDYREPYVVRLLKTRTDILAHFMEHHPETRDQYINQWFGWMNGLKLYMGREKALNDPEIMGRKIGFERQFRDAVAAKPELLRQYGTLWDEIADVRSQMAEHFPTLMALNTNGSLRSQTLATAAAMIQYAQAVQGGAPDSVVQGMRRGLENREIDTRLDHHMIEATIEDAALWLGKNDPFVVRALAGKTPAEAGHAIIDESPSCTDAEARRAMLDNPQQILTTGEPAIALMREALPRFQQAAARFGQLSNQEEVRTTKLARASFDVYGTELPPDATFTLRIADGVVSSYEYNGTKAPAWTTFYGLYDRWASHKGRDEWELPERWQSPPAEFDKSTPLNMVHTNDTVGGNSGSPVINTDREIVGLLFDGNIESLSGDFIYITESGGRSVSVLTTAILEALRHMYDADRIAQELVGM
jgi:hypothetical protein